MISIIPILVFAILSHVYCSLNQDCSNAIVPSTPYKFGILTMTYERLGMEDHMYLFNKYLKHYANLQCDLFDNIYILWNNQQSWEEKGIKIQSGWKKNVTFIQTPYNNLGWKYSVPQSAPERVFFTVDDDLYLKCEQMRRGFTLWQNNSIGDLGPLVSYDKRSFVLQKFKQQFRYQVRQDAMTKYYTFSLMGQAFVSRQYFDLYYSDLQEIRKIRKIVQELQNCEDIAMNYIVSYFYSEFLPKVLKHAQTQETTKQDNQKQTNKTEQINLTKPVKIVGISSAKNHISKRHQCVNKFAQIFGFNPERFIDTNPASAQSLKLNYSCIVLKKQEYYRKVIKHKNLTQIFQNDQMFNPKLTKQEIEKFQEKLKMKQKRQMQEQILKQKLKKGNQNIITGQKNKMKNEKDTQNAGNSYYLSIFLISLILLAAWIILKFISRNIKKTKLLQANRQGFPTNFDLGNDQIETINKIQKQQNSQNTTIHQKSQSQKDDKQQRLNKQEMQQVESIMR